MRRLRCAKVLAAVGWVATYQILSRVADWSAYERAQAQQQTASVTPSDSGAERAGGIAPAVVAPAGVAGPVTDADLTSLSSKPLTGARSAEELLAESDLSQQLTATAMDLQPDQASDKLLHSNPVASPGIPVAVTVHAVGYLSSLVVVQNAYEKDLGNRRSLLRLICPIPTRTLSSVTKTARVRQKLFAGSRQLACL